jgi:hypothetical protein
MLSRCEAWSVPTPSVLTLRRPGGHPTPHADAFSPRSWRAHALFPGLRPHHRGARTESRFGLVPARDAACLTDRSRAPCAAVPYRGRGRPVAWAA